MRISPLKQITGVSMSTSGGLRYREKSAGILVMMVRLFDALAEAPDALRRGDLSGAVDASGGRT